MTNLSMKQTGYKEEYFMTNEAGLEFEDQHKQISDYRDLVQKEIDLINEGKALAEQIGSYVEKLKNLSDNSRSIDKRWLSIARTDLQKGFMSLIRSIARPTTF